MSSWGVASIASYGYICITLIRTSDILRKKNRSSAFCQNNAEDLFRSEKTVIFYQILQVFHSWIRSCVSSSLAPWMDNLVNHCVCVVVFSTMDGQPCQPLGVCRRLQHHGWTTLSTIACVSSSSAPWMDNLVNHCVCVVVFSTMDGQPCQPLPVRVMSWPIGMLERQGELESQTFSRPS